MATIKENQTPEKAENSKTGKTKKTESHPVKLGSVGVILSPVITEKSTDLGALNKYVFKVAGHSTKSNIEKEIESVYKVKVKNVHVIKIPSKLRRQGSKSGRKSGYKKAIVTLKEGDKINLVEGV